MITPERHPTIDRAIGEYVVYRLDIGGVQLVGLFLHQQKHS
jgi:hypothetical protein